MTDVLEVNEQDQSVPQSLRSIEHRILALGNDDLPLSWLGVDAEVGRDECFAGRLVSGGQEDRLSRRVSRDVCKRRTRASEADWRCESDAVARGQRTEVARVPVHIHVPKLDLVLGQQVLPVRRKQPRDGLRAPKDVEYEVSSVVGDARDEDRVLRVRGVGPEGLVGLLRGAEDMQDGGKPSFGRRVVLVLGRKGFVDKRLRLTVEARSVNKTPTDEV